MNKYVEVFTRLSPKFQVRDIGCHIEIGCDEFKEEDIEAIGSVLKKDNRLRFVSSNGKVTLILHKEYIEV